MTIDVAFFGFLAADAEVIRRALCRDSRGNASGPLAKALDIILTDGAGS